MNFFSPPPVITASLFATVPESLYRKGVTGRVIPSTGQPPKIFIEGITTDPQGNIFVVDIPFGQVLKLDAKSREFSLVKQWDGEPNGLAVREDGMLIVADHKEGMLLLDPSSGELQPLLTRRNLQRFKGPNDVIVASNGDVYFTDQGQTGMSDPTGLVYRLSPNGRLETLLSNGPSPNGLVLTPDERFLYVAMTRENSVWICPLHADGTTTKVAQFFHSFGLIGPDGLTIDAEGNLFICHPSLGCIFVVDNEGMPVARIVPPEDRHPEGHRAKVTNCIFGSTPEDRKKLYFVASTTGDVFVVEWHCEGGTPVRKTKE